MIIETITERPLGKLGKDYMLDFLQQSGGLAEYVAPLVSNSVFAPLPLSLSTERLFDFDSGGINNLDPWQSWLFGDLLSKSEGTFIVQDVWAERSDFYKVRQEYDWYFFSDDYVYYYIDLSRLAAGIFVELEKQVSSFQFVCFYTASKIEEVISNDHEIGQEYLRMLSSNVKSIYVSAYDRESYVVWRSESDLS